MCVAVPDEADLRAAFEAPSPLTVGVEEEVMLLDPRTLDLAPCAEQALHALGGDPRFRRELPAAQLEIVLRPTATAGQAATALLAARRRLADVLGGDLVLAAAGVHPFASPLGKLNADARYAAIGREFGDVARLQLVFALQVHVAVRGADRALAVHNAMRGLLPLIAALAANGPLYAGRDTGLASVRPKLADLLPRQGVPPVITGWDGHAAALARLGDPAQWWWELRPHPVHGTLEVRVPDAQSTVADSAAVIAVVHACAAWLAGRFDAGERLEVAETWVVEEDRWLACRHGAQGPLAERVRTLLDALEPVAERIGCAAELADARRLAEYGGAQRRRAAMAEAGVRGAVEQLAGDFLRE